MDAGYSQQTNPGHIGWGIHRGNDMRKLDLQQDLLNFIGRRVLIAHRAIKPKLLNNVCGKGEEACAEQEAAYLVGLADGLALADLVSVSRRGMSMLMT